MKTLAGSTLLIVIGLLLLVTTAKADSIGLADKALVFAAQYSKKSFDHEVDWLISVVHPDIAKAASKKEEWSIRKYVELRNEIYFSEAAQTINEELSYPQIAKTGSDIVAFVPWRKERDFGLYIAKSDGLYMLFSTDEGKTWSIYDNDCSHYNFLKVRYPAISSQVDLVRVSKFNSASAVITSSGIRISSTSFGQTVK